MSNCKDPGLYIHVPFCRTKCPYCDFYSITSLSLIPDWREALLREILVYKDRCRNFDSLYLGGGTPSLLSEADRLSPEGSYPQTAAYLTAMRARSDQ